MGGVCCVLSPAIEAEWRPNYLQSNLKTSLQCHNASVYLIPIGLNSSVRRASDVGFRAVVALMFKTRLGRVNGQPVASQSAG